jgi:hypothetical protein
MLDQRGQLLRAAVGFVALPMPSYDRALQALCTWLDSWSGIGHVTVGITRQGFDLQLTRYDERGLARDLLHDRDGALADERDRHRMGASVAKEEAEMRPSASSHAGRVARPSWFHKLSTPPGGSMRRLRENVVYVA